MKNKMKNAKGITLLALVITIVILIILATVAINWIFGENGLINRTEQAKFEHSKAEAQERLELVLADAYAEKKVTQEYTEEEFLNEHLEDFIHEQETEANIFEYGEDELISLNGHAFYLDRRVPKLGEYAWPEGELPALITRIDVTNKTFTEISIDVKTVGADDCKYKYSIKEFETDDSTYGQVIEKSENTNTFTGLTSPKIYTIKVELIENNEVADTETVNVKLGEVDDLTLSFGKHSWSNGVASMSVNTTTSYQIEYQIGGIEEGSWKTIANGGTISNITNNSDVYARLSDGTNKTDYIYKKIVDNIEPMITKFESTETTYNSITVQAEAIDNESGLKSSDTYKFYLNDETTEKGKNTTGIFNYTGLNGLTDYKLRVEAYDNVGNKKESTINVTTKEPTLEEALDISENQKIYVKIPNIKNPSKPILCNVLYNDDTYGLQVISVNCLENVTLGYDDPNAIGSSNIEKAKDSYNKSVSTLNNRAMEYIDSNNENYSIIKKLIEDSRCVGTNPINKNEGMYEIDREQMSKLGIIYIKDTNYWLASLINFEQYGSNYYGLPIWHAYNMEYAIGLYCTWYSGGLRQQAFSETCGLRLVFTLKTGIKITGGNGTEDSPYTLGV